MNAWTVVIKTEVLTGPDTTAKVIPYETLAQATNDFDLRQKVGDGRFGSVFKVSTNPTRTRACILLLYKSLQDNWSVGFQASSSPLQGTFRSTRE